MVSALVVLTLACIVMSATTRRDTWTLRWEQASTLAVAFLGLGVLLTATPVWKIFPLILNWNIPAGAVYTVGHGCLLVAAGAMAMAARERTIGSSKDILARWIALPLVASLAMMSISVVVGQWVMPEQWQGWLTMYLLFFNGGLIYLLGYGILALYMLAFDPRQRPMALLYIIPSSVGLIAHVAQWVLNFVVPEESRSTWASIITVGILFWTAGFALATAYSWRQKTQGFRRLQRALRS